MVGKKKKPTALHLLHGNPSKLSKSAFQNEPKPDIPLEVPKPPTVLKGNTEARNKWKELAPKLWELGLLTELEIDLLAHYCQLYSRLMDITRRLKDIEDGKNEKNKDPLITTSPKGYMQQSALIGMQNVTQREMRSIMTEFGMTPSSRSRMKVEKPKKKNKLEMIRKRNKASNQ